MTDHAALSNPSAAAGPASPERPHIDCPHIDCPHPDGPHGAQTYMFIGTLFFLANFAAPHVGLIDVPVSFFLKNRLHLPANQTAVFRLIVALPLIFGFVFGFVRDRWSPFGHGDRAHLIIFSGVTAAIYAVLAFQAPNYWTLAIGLLLATVAFQMVYSVANGLTTVLGQASGLAGGLAVASLIAGYLPQVVSYLLGGVLSSLLESHNAIAAIRALFLVAGGLMIVIGVIGGLGPRQIFAAGERTRTTGAISTDIGRLMRHWPIYPVMTMQLLWQLSPATGTVLQYHLSNTLHATDAQFGQWNAIFLACLIPGLLIYAYLCRRVRLQWLLWGGFGVAVFQLAPFLFITTPAGALVAAAYLGVLGAFAQAALTDLSIRSAPKGLEGTMAMMYLAFYWIAFRLGDVLGTALYDRFGFVPPVIATIASTALVLPVLLLVPRRLIMTRDGEALHLAG